MFRKRPKREVPELNATSTADISFMLLTFFLVTTSMDVDKGIVRKLPPMGDSTHIQPTEVVREQLYEIEITANDKYLVDGKVTDLAKIKTELGRFITKVGDKHLVSVVSNPNSSYNAYFLLQNEISLAYKSVRNDFARRKYGKSYNKCTDIQREEIRLACPQHLTEPQKMIKE